MQIRLRNFLKSLTLAQRFMIATLLILLGGMLGLGEWVGQQIEQGVIHRTAATTALFVDSFIAPNLQELAQSDSLTPEHIAILNRLLAETPLGQQIVFFKVWDANGQVLFSSEPATIGQTFPMSDDLLRAWQGEVTSGISELENEENVLDRTAQSRLLEIYSPVRLVGSNQIIAVAEFYQTVGDLEQDIAVARQRSWLMVGLAMLVMYLLLAGFIRQTSNTIQRQQMAMSQQVNQLAGLLAQNATLHERIRRAAARTTALNERFLRRISAELHDGPVQDLGLALLRLDPVVRRFSAADPVDSSIMKDLDVVHTSIQRAMQEIRALSTGLGVPQLNNLTLPETLSRAVRVHEQRSRTKVTLRLDGTPERASLPVKITLYRLVQEALNNAYRHAGGLGQEVNVHYLDGQLNVEVSDQGAGFGHRQVTEWGNHLGIAGMRERIESLGGNFRIESTPGQGTKVIASLALQGEEEADE